MLIIQGHGRKHWKLFEPAALSPRMGWVEPQAAGKPAFSAVLEPGLGLYIPRGWGHEVSGFAGEVSVHYTVGFRRQSALDLLEEVRRLQPPTWLEAPADPETEAVQPNVAIDDTVVEHAVGAWRARMAAHPADGPVAAALKQMVGFSGCSFTAPFTGGLVFTDSPESRSSEIGFASGGFRFAAQRSTLGLLQALLAGESVSIDDPARLAAQCPEVDPDDPRVFLVGLARRDVAHLTGASS